MFSKKVVMTSLLGAIVIPLTAFSGAYSAPSTTVPAAPSGKIEVELVGATTGDKESDSVIEALRQLLRGLEERDLTAIEACLGRGVVLIDDRTSNLIFGKKQVLEHIKTNVIGDKSASPIKGITVYHPFVRV